MKPAVSLPRLAVPCLFALAAVLALPGESPLAPLVATIPTGDALPVVAAWSPDGQRLAYGTEIEVRPRNVPLSAEEASSLYPGEVWVTEPAQGKPKRILKYDFLRGRKGEFYSFSVERLAWSLDGQKLAVEMTDEKKNTATFFLTAEGKRVELGSTSQNFVAGYGAAWLADNESLGLLSEAVAPRLLHQIGILRVAAGRVIPLFPESTFAAVAWLPRAHQAVLVERDPEFARRPRLLLGDLESGKLTPLEDLSEGYLGGLQATPDESTVSYFVGQRKLAVRRPAPGAEVEYWPVPFGRYAWAGPRRGVLFIEAKEPGQRTGWLTLYDHGRQRMLRVLPDELIQDFWVSPDGQQVAVLTVGLNPQLRIYRLLAQPAP